MAEVILKNVRKVYPNTESKKKKKKDEAVEKKNNLEITDEGVVAVQDFNIDVADKEFIVLVGPSGCGKSTTLRMIAGLEEISGGELFIDGKQMNDVAPKDRDIAMVFQNYALYPHMTVYENIAFPLKLKKIAETDADGKTHLKKMPNDEIDRRVRESAHFAGLTDDLLEKSPFALSGGQKRRVAIAGVIAMEPEVLVLDEPTAGLDPKERVRFRNLISALAQDKVLILSTHIVSDVEYIADEILIMRAGQIVASGTIEEILAQVSGVVWECVVTPREADVMSARMAVGNVRYDHAGMAIVRIVSDTAPHSSARLVEPTLEDVYLYIFQEGSVSQENRPHDSRNARRGGRRV